MSNINLPAHLTQVLDLMSKEMGVPRDSLVSQAVYQLARINGYVVPGKVSSEAPAPSTALARPSVMPPPPEDASSEDEEGNPFDQPLDEGPPGDEPMDDGPLVDEGGDEAPVTKERGPAVVISMAGREAYRMSNDQVLVGRGKHCDFVIESNRVSREHARFTRKGNDFFVEDLGSSNGTFVGAGSKDKLVSPKKLKDGDEVTFGTEKVKVSIKR